MPQDKQSVVQWIHVWTWNKTLCEQRVVVVQSWTFHCLIQQEQSLSAQLHPAAPFSVDSPPSTPHMPRTDLLQKHVLKFKKRWTRWLLSLCCIHSKINEQITKDSVWAFSEAERRRLHNYLLMCLWALSLLLTLPFPTSCHFVPIHWDFTQINEKLSSSVPEVFA